MSCLADARWDASICTCPLLSDQTTGPLFLLDKIPILFPLLVKIQYAKVLNQSSTSVEDFPRESTSLVTSIGKIKNRKYSTIAHFSVQLLHRPSALILRSDFVALSFFCMSILSKNYISRKWAYLPLNVASRLIER